jgi:hypothetical protein
MQKTGHTGRFRYLLLKDVRFDVFPKRKRPGSILGSSLPDSIHHYLVFPNF